VRFDYRSYLGGALRPVVPITVEHSEKYINYTALMDTGADTCLFSSDVAHMLGIELKAVPAREMVGIANTTVQAYYHVVRIRIGDVSYRTSVGFAEMPNELYGLLGQQGFFDHFVVTFDRSRKIARVM
jgi:predicted aspartyl protease